MKSLIAIILTLVVLYTTYEMNTKIVVVTSVNGKYTKEITVSNNYHKGDTVLSNTYAYIIQ